MGLVLRVFRLGFFCLQRPFLWGIWNLFLEDEPTTSGNESLEKLLNRTPTIRYIRTKMLFKKKWHNACNYLNLLESEASKYSMHSPPQTLQPIHYQSQGTNTFSISCNHQPNVSSHTSQYH